MLKYLNYDIVFKEIPEETTLAINITNCPFKCDECHSPELQEDIGKYLTTRKLRRLINSYKTDITCICFMGGDNNLDVLWKLAKFVRQNYDIKIAWYSGRQCFPLIIPDWDGSNQFSYRKHKFPFDYIKYGRYEKEKGPINQKTTNQRLYQIRRVEKSKKLFDIVDITYKFWNENQN